MESDCIHLLIRRMSWSVWVFLALIGLVAIGQSAPGLFTLITTTWLGAVAVTVIIFASLYYINRCWYDCLTCRYCD